MEEGGRLELPDAGFTDANLFSRQGRYQFRSTFHWPPRFGAVLVKRLKPPTFSNAPTKGPDGLLARTCTSVDGLSGRCSAC